MGNSLTRYNDPFADIHSQLDDIFSTFLSPANTRPVRAAPMMDVYTEEDGSSLVTEIQAPGFKPEDVEVSIANGVMEIRGEKHQKDEQKDKKRNYMLRESHESFYRSIVLPKNANADDVQAEFDDGVLKITVPFKELPQPKKVSITAGKHTSS